MAEDTRRRIAALRELMEERGYDACVIRDLATIRWLTGAASTLDDERSHTIFIDGEGLWLHTDSRYDEAFKANTVDADAWRIDRENVGHPAWTAARIAAARARTVAVEDTLELGFYDELVHEVDRSCVACLWPRLHGDEQGLRMVKDEGELELLREAQAITDAAFAHMCEFIKPGMTELEIRAELEHYMLSHGADALSFGSIVACGPNAANPHAKPGERKAAKGELVLMDYGAGLKGYHADMTRTVALGEPPAEVREAYEVVKRAHEEAAAAVRPDVIGVDIHDIAKAVIEDAGYGPYFNHGLGHGVGIEIHEEPSFGPRWTKPVPAGSVVTIEPGIYKPGEFGMRLEDTGVVTEHGFESFATSPHELQILDC